MASRSGFRHKLGVFSLTATLALAAAPAGAQTDATPSLPPAGLPKGAIVAFLPDPQSREYSDLKGLKSWLREQGWALCDGSEGTPDLNYRMLLGTIHPQEAGQNLGSRTHDHRITGNADAPFGRDHNIRSGVGRALRVPADGHKHRLDAGTDQAEHLPLSLRVIYIMKIR
jgi:hypothetical protein